MSGGHRHLLFSHTETGLHRLAPEAKIGATFLFVCAVVATPREAFWAFGVDATLLVAVAAAARVPLLHLARRLVLELPFLAFAFFLPFLGAGPRLDVAWFSVSQSGLWGAWNILVKGTMGVAATSLLGATTTVPELVGGLERLRLPKVLVGIIAFMVRYLEVVTEEMARMRIARLSRGHDPRWIWQAQAVAKSAGSLFIRSFERGERVHLAMLSRGYDGTLYRADVVALATRDWATTLLLPAAALSVCLAAVLS